MGKTRDLFKKIRDTKGIFHTKMCSKKDRNGMDQAEAEDIKKRWKEYKQSFDKRIRSMPYPKANTFSFSERYHSYFSLPLEKQGYTLSGYV